MATISAARSSRSFSHNFDSTNGFTTPRATQNTNTHTLNSSYYEDQEYFQTPKNFIFSLTASPAKLPVHYRENLLKKIQGMYDKFENRMQKKSERQSLDRSTLATIEVKREEKMKTMSNMMNKSIDLRTNRIRFRVNKIVEHHTHVDETKQRHDEQLQEAEREHLKDRNEFANSLTQYADQRESFFLTSYTQKHVERIREQNEIRQSKLEEAYAVSAIKNESIIERLESTKNKRLIALQTRTQSLVNTASETAKKNQRSYSEQKRFLENQRLGQVATKLNKIKDSNLIKQRANEIVAQHSKEEWLRKNEMLSDNQHRIQETIDDKNTRLNNKFNTTVVFQPRESKINIELSTMKVLQKNSELKEIQEIKNQELLHTHEEYANNNRILRTTFNKFNDLTRRAYFLAKQNDV